MVGVSKAYEMWKAEHTPKDVEYVGPDADLLAVLERIATALEAIRDSIDRRPT